MRTKRFIFSILIIVIFACRPFTVQGVLDITAPASATLTGKTVSIAAQTSTGVIGDSDNANLIGVKVSDDGTAGWSAVMTSTHFTTRATHKTIIDTDSDGIIGFTGTYDGLDGVLDPNGTFKVTIVTGGAVGTSTFDWWDPAGNKVGTASTTAASVTLSNGISVAFAAATYVTADSWSAGVDVFPYNYETTKGLTATPSTIHNASGSLTGVTAGSAELMTGSAATSNAKTVMTAAVNNGFGDYFIDVHLSQPIHPNSLSGSYTSTATITVS